jgi:hypothetical protein
MNLLNDTLINYICEYYYDKKQNHPNITIDINTHSKTFDEYLKKLNFFIRLRYYSLDQFVLYNDEQLLDNFDKTLMEAIQIYPNMIKHINKKRFNRLKNKYAKEIKDVIDNNLHLYQYYYFT